MLANGIVSVAEAVAFHRSLRTLSLEGNDASATEAGLALAKVVRNNSSLHTLNFG